MTPLTKKTPSWFDVMYVLVAAQGLLTCILLWVRRQNRTANRILAFPIAAITVSSLYVLYVRSGAFQSDPRWLLSIDTLPALYGPLFYLHALALTSRPQRWVLQLLHLFHSRRRCDASMSEVTPAPWPPLRAQRGC
ncbi:hypothetical protein WMF38_53535 [Sorangium sp. So ce118]